MRKEDPAAEKGIPVPQKFRSIRTKFLVYFVLLFLTILIAILFIDIWGVPFTPYTGMQGLARTEAFRTLRDC
jgi:uncharacterized membrane protein